jgi:hypothetical protein
MAPPETLTSSSRTRLSSTAQDTAVTVSFVIVIKNGKVDILAQFEYINLLKDAMVTMVKNLLDEASETRMRSRELTGTACNLTKTVKDDPVLTNTGEFQRFSSLLSNYTFVFTFFFSSDGRKCYVITGCPSPIDDDEEPIISDESFDARTDFLESPPNSTHGDDVVPPNTTMKEPIISDESFDPRTDLKSPLSSTHDDDVVPPNTTTKEPIISDESDGSRTDLKSAKKARMATATKTISRILEQTW